MGPRQWSAHSLDGARSRPEALTAAGTRIGVSGKRIKRQQHDFGGQDRALTTLVMLGSKLQLVIALLVLLGGRYASGQECLDNDDNGIQPPSPLIASVASDPPGADSQPVERCIIETLTDQSG